MNRAFRRKNKISQVTKISPDDQGPLDIIMATKGDQVVVEFGKMVRWFSMGEREANDFIVKLQKHIDKLKQGEQ